jgi:hypothetical protein
MKTILAAFMALGMVLSTGIIATGAAHAAGTSHYSDRATVTGNEAG